MNTHDLYHPSWLPPHCPNPKCHFHNEMHEGWPFKRMGYYMRKVEPYRIRRFKCKHCGVTFSSQTFSTTFWLKRPDILPQLLTKTVACMANRQIAEDLQVSPTCIDLQLNHLGRHCLLFHAEMVKNLKPPETLVIDGFESFELSQYHPFHFHLAVDKDTSFIHWFTDSEVRRKGRMTPEQRVKREEKERLLGKPDPQAVRKDMGELLRVVTAGAEKVTIHSDAHKAYPPAMRTVPAKIVHIITSSKDHRDYFNNLFEINLLDLMIRHCSGCHKRETIAYSKRRQAAAMKLMIFLVWRNYMRYRRVRKCKETPAMMVGLCRRPLTMGEVLARRIFVWKVELEGRWRDYYWGRVKTRGLKVNRCHNLKLAN